MLYVSFWMQPDRVTQLKDIYLHYFEVHSLFIEEHLLAVLLEHVILPQTVDVVVVFFVVAVLQILGF